jgi:regulator of sigma E protease
MNIVIAFIAFNFIVLVHEFGHFIVAKASGIKVLEFSLFMGPRIFSVKKGETVYSLRMFPILAYVKMEGEEERSTSDRAFNRKPLAARAAVIAAGPLMNLLIAVLLLTIVFSFTGFDTTEITHVDDNSPAFISDIRSDDRIISYNGKRVYKPMEVLQFLYVSKGIPAEVELIRNGRVITRNLVPVEIPPEKKYMFGFTVAETTGENSNLLHSVSPGTPAEGAGLMKGDRIVALDGTKIKTKDDIDKFMKNHDGSSIKVTVLRGGNEMILDITPILQEMPAGYYLGLEFAVRKGTIFETVKHTFVFTYSTVRSVAYSIAWLISGTVSINQVMGPVGIVSTIGTVVQQSRARLTDLIINLLNVTAMISIALGATNLIPFPALDGSKLLLLAVEGIRRKPLPPEKEAFITMVGFVLLIILAIVTFYNDLARILGG